MIDHMSGLSDALHNIPDALHNIPGFLLSNAKAEFLEAKEQAAEGGPIGIVAAAGIAVSGYVYESTSERGSSQRKAVLNRLNGQEALLIPINVYFHSLLFSIYSFVGQNHPSAVADDDSAFTSDDRAVSKFAHDWVWDAPEGLFQLSKDKRRPVAVPYELPADLTEQITKDFKSNPNSELAVKYRTWVQNELQPAIQLVREFATADLTSMERIPVERLKELFRDPPIGFKDWGFTPRGVFFSMWFAYKRGWDSVVEEWERGDFSRVRPSAPFPVGMLYYVIECQSIVGERKESMVGFSQMSGWAGENEK
eukprot:CAMPEP_0181293072 /NCGR_PEP_ID=MMETSP1101-20121128/2864_1 /TAXON_ID=46948 /ORGANISM="Rhodomonas abbreviata, Strain Caron Lab Isolate" /LENGTH=308 /DNA_ID=CAMNT_0023397623 /DNA_START=220 /DNA_END=1146 /DNA_ORIENTATION=-